MFRASTMNAASAKPSSCSQSTTAAQSQSLHAGLESVESATMKTTQK